jgi:ectoine hydroxylase-related dioxygenase (phytanoyl-CoA dioxygenase family)
LLVGVFLSAVRTEFAGNFTIWPGSHRLIETCFIERGPQAMREGMPKVALAEPRQLLCSPGDVVFCHYQLAQAAAVNTSDFDPSRFSSGFGIMTCAPGKHAGVT